MKERITTADGTFYVDSDDPDPQIPTKKEKVPRGERVRDEGAKDDYGPFCWIGRVLHVTPRTAEWLVAIVLALLGIALTTYLARNLWFTSDEWEYLANRKATSFNDLTRPIGGHTTFWSVLLLRFTYNVVGVDFWPWFYIPRLIGHTLLSLYLWRVMRWRGADALVAITALAILLVLGASGYQRALQIGTWMVYAILVYCALTITKRMADPTVRDRVLVALALFAAVLANGYAVAILAGIVAALLLYRSIVVWIPSLIPAAVTYAYLFFSHRDDIKPKPEFKLSSFTEIPSASFKVLRRAVESGTSLPSALAGVVVVGLGVWLISLLVRRRLDLFDAIMLLTVAAGLCALTIQRVAIDAEATDRLRYGYLVTVLLSVVFIPQIRLPKRLLAQAAVILIGLGLIAANVDQLNTALDVRIDVSQEARVLSVAAAGMMDADEPQVPGPSTLAHGLEISELQQLVDEGYHPSELPEDTTDRELVVSNARGALRMGLIDQNRPRDGYRPPAGDAVVTDAPVDADGCVRLSQGDPVTGTVTGPGRLQFDKTRPQSLQLTWTDEYGDATRFFDDPDVRKGEVELATPTDTAELVLVSPVGGMTVCGFTES